MDAQDQVASHAAEQERVPRKGLETGLRSRATRRDQRIGQLDLRVELHDPRTQAEIAVTQAEQQSRFARRLQAAIAGPEPHHDIALSMPLPPEAAVTASTICS